MISLRAILEGHQDSRRRRYLTDRVDRRRVSALFLFARVLCAVGFLVYSQLAPDPVWPLFALAFVFGAADAMLAPSRRSIAPLLAPPEMFPQVVALWTATFTGSAIVGPVIGGFLYSVGPSEAYALAAILEFAAIIPILMIVYVREPERITDRPTLHTALEGLRFVRHTPVVLGTISLDLFAVLFGGALALIPAGTSVLGTPHYLAPDALRRGPAARLGLASRRLRLPRPCRGAT